MVKKTEPHLRVFANRSELVKPDGSTDVFLEGATTSTTKQRQKQIVEALEGGFLLSLIEHCKTSPQTLQSDLLEDVQKEQLEQLVTAVTSEVGRSLVGLLVLQLCIKTIAPTQSIRLHKSSNSSNDFSWQEGISMRMLDRQFITPALRAFDLLKLNKDGFMMTRTLAENYPYSGFYKAQIRGRKANWMTLVEQLESRTLPALPALEYLIAQLLNRSEQFQNLAAITLEAVQRTSSQAAFTLEYVYQLLFQHMEASDYAARIMEISMHALLQGLQDLQLLTDYSLVALSQMRSANKKHGNVGDVELTQNHLIVEAWDAKYGKLYLRDELEELGDKVALHPQLHTAGFVTQAPAQRLDELQSRIADLEASYGIQILILSFSEWVEWIVDRAKENSPKDWNQQQVAQAWLLAYVESLAQHRPNIAPIDEPTYHWLEKLLELMKKNIQ